MWTIFVPLNLVGLLLSIGGTLIGLLPLIQKEKIKEVRISLRLALCGAALGLCAIELGGLVAIIPATHVIGNEIAASGFGALLLLPGLIYIVFINITDYRITRIISARHLILVIVIAAFLVALPPALAYLATSGSHGVPLFGPTIGGPYGGASALFLAAVPVFTIYCPDVISRNIPWENADESIKECVPEWLANIATVSTILYGFSLHFSAGPLARIPIAAVIVTNLIAAIFLRPIYRSAVVASWKWGIVEAVLLQGWGRQQKAALTTLRERWPEPSVEHPKPVEKQLPESSRSDSPQ